MGSGSSSFIKDLGEIESGFSVEECQKIWKTFDKDDSQGLQEEEAKAFLRVYIQSRTYLSKKRTKQEMDELVHHLWLRIEKNDNGEVGLDQLLAHSRTPRRSAGQPAAAPASEHDLVVEVICAQDLPKTILDKEMADPYIKLRLTTPQGLLKGTTKAKTLHFSACEVPYWRALRCLLAVAHAEDFLEVELWRKDHLGKGVSVGSMHVPVADLTRNGEGMETTHTFPSGHAKGCRVSLRRLHLPPHLLGRKTLFFVRHGESEWNKAQSKGNVKNMAHFDHALSKLGVAQAKALREYWQQSVACQAPDSPSASPWELKFLSEQAVVFSSPLTRALETALLALKGHPSIKQFGIKCLRAAREIKGLGGLDTVGVECGEGIMARVKKKLLRFLPPEEVDEVCSVQVDPYDCQTKWWTAAAKSDRHKSVADRMYDFLCSVHYYPAEVVIVVGHSLFFMTLSELLSSSRLQGAHPTLAKRMAKRKLMNAGVIGLELSFYEVGEGTKKHEEVEIVDAQPIFGTRFLAGRKERKKQKKQLKKAGKPGKASRFLSLDSRQTEEIIEAMKAGFSPGDLYLPSGIDPTVQEKDSDSETSSGSDGEVGEAHSSMVVHHMEEYIKGAKGEIPKGSDTEESEADFIRRLSVTFNSLHRGVTPPPDSPPPPPPPTYSPSNSPPPPPPPEEVDDDNELGPGWSGWQNEVSTTEDPSSVHTTNRLDLPERSHARISFGEDNEESRVSRHRTSFSLSEDGDREPEIVE